jgi:hypothetical protein
VSTATLVIVTAHELLMAYDQQLRAEAETSGAIALSLLGPLLLVTFAGGRGFVTYRDLGSTDARARSALAMGKTFIYSDSTEYSRPVLERSGFLKVSTTTPYRWRR